MKTRKRGTAHKPLKKAEEKSQGTVWAEQTRAKCNKLTEAQREKLLDRAMQIAYAAEGQLAAPRRG